MPASGFPLVIYAHGTGGSFGATFATGSPKRSRLSPVSTVCPLPSWESIKCSTGRGAESNDSPNNLFYNFANPYAARDNALQGAVDQMSLAKLAAALDLKDPTLGSDLEIDPHRIEFWGHSQGATEGSIAGPYVTEIGAMVFSGQGASLIDALLTKTNPVNIAASVPYALSDLDPVQPTRLRDGIFHPVLSLLQMYVDPADPLTHAAQLAPTKAGGHHLFQVYGLGDTYAPRRRKSPSRSR